MGLTKATITNLDTNDTIKCLFNPNEYTISKSNSWQPKGSVGLNVPKLDFTGGGSRTLTVELFFDVYENAAGDVRSHVNKLWALTMIDEKNKNKSTKKSRPPLCLFQWGPDWHFKAAITSLSVRYTLFRHDGTPVRAVANITMQEAEDETKKKGTNPTSFAQAGHRLRTVKPSDTIQYIAYEEYGDPGKWRLIADANQLSNPEILTPGTDLAIPAL